MLARLSVWSKVQTCIWPSWCHCHSLSLASVKSRLVLPFCYRLTWVVPEKGPLNGCVCVCVCVSLFIRTFQDQVYSTLTKYTVVDQMLKFSYGHIFLSRFMAATKNPDIRQWRGRLTCSLCMCDCSAQVWPRRQQQQSRQQRQEMSTDNCRWQRSSHRYCWY